jgi:hypothetical protein
MYQALRDETEVGHVKNIGGTISGQSAALAIAGTNEWHVLTWIKDADCDPVVGL